MRTRASGIVLVVAFLLGGVAGRADACCGTFPAFRGVAPVPLLPMPGSPTLSTGGAVNENPYDMNSVANPYGRYGSPYSMDSVNNPYSTMGNPYNPQSATSPYGFGAPPVYVPYGSGR